MVPTNGAITNEIEHHKRSEERSSSDHEKRLGHDSKHHGDLPYDPDEGLSEEERAAIV